MNLNAELLLYKNLLNIMLIKSNNNIKIYLSKIKKSFNDFNFFASLILNEFNKKYEFIIFTIINHVRIIENITNSINKID